MLINTRENDLNFIVPDYEVMVKEMFDWIKKHIYLYKHYQLIIEGLSK